MGEIMYKLIKNTLLKLLDKSIEFRVRLFIILAIAGTLISFIMFLNSIIIGNTESVLINGILTLLSGTLLVYSYFSGNYQLCYRITIFVVFLFLFPVLFFIGGGYHGGMPSFFIFALVFTVLMLEKWWAIIISFIEMFVYVSICLIAYYNPASVTPLNSDSEVMTDNVISFVTVCIACGIVLYFHLNEYIHQKELLSSQNNKLRKYDEMKSTFLTTVAHEIKNPLTAIIVHARDTSELLYEAPLDYKLMEENLKTIEQIVLRIDHIVLDLMDTVSIEQGRLSLSLAPTRLYTLIKDVGNTYFEGSNLGDNTLSFDLDPSLPPLQADYARLVQVLTNLLSNASRHTQNGIITISLRKKNTSQVICVTDNGKGMDEHMKQQAFKGYVSESKDYWRHGIGLYVCYQIVTAHGGDIWIESDLGKGTKVSFSIPIKED